MPTGMLWMAIGIAAVAWLPRLPSPVLLACAAIVIALLAGCLWWYCRHRCWRNVTQRICVAIVALTLGMVWGCGYGYYIRSGLLPIELEQQSLLLRGRIDGLVEQHVAFVSSGESAQRGAVARPVQHFQFAVDEKVSDSKLPRLIQLNWYDAEKAPQPGERWQLRVKLKRPRGFANPAGFDYAAWLIANRVGATGYVERSDDNQQMAAPPELSIYCKLEMKLVNKACGSLRLVAT